MVIVLPSPTYTLISETVLGSAQASVTFSSIPGTYKDLVLECVASVTAGSPNYQFTFNGDTGSNYSNTNLQGSGSAAASNRASNAATIYAGQTGTTISTMFAQIQNYASTNMNKTALVRSNTTYDTVNAIVGLWRSTSAITSLAVSTSSSTFVSGSTFRLWGVVG